MKHRSLLGELIRQSYKGKLDNIIIVAYVTHPDLLIDDITTITMQVGTPHESRHDSTFIINREHFPDQYLTTYRNQGTLYDPLSLPSLAYAAQYMGIKYLSDHEPKWDEPYYNPMYISEPLIASLDIHPIMNKTLSSVFNDNIYATILVASILNNEDIWIYNDMTTLQKRCNIKDSPFKTRLIMADGWIKRHRGTESMVPKSFITYYNKLSNEVGEITDYMSPDDIISHLLQAFDPILVDDIREPLTIAMNDTLPVIISKYIVPLSHENDCINNWIIGE
jgi:hypothetical protein